MPLLRSLTTTAASKHTSILRALQTRTMAHATNTSLYKLNHTMLRVKDPKISVKFYEDNFGMKVISKRDFEDAKFTLYFLAFDSPKAVSHGKNWTDRESVLELTHNWGTESDPNYKISNGNEQPHPGFSHLAFTVDSVEAAIDRLKTSGVKIHKEPHAGDENKSARILDPDNYHIQLIGPLEGAVATTDLETYRFNHTMLRVKDIEKSINFYRSVLGMSLIYKKEYPQFKFDLYFFGYRKGRGDITKQEALQGEGGVGLLYNYGSEKDEKLAYHNGNNEPQGFGHLCISVDDLEASCARFEDLQVNWKKRLTDGRMKSVAFILDPDQYWIEVIQNEGIKQREGW